MLGTWFPLAKFQRFDPPPTIDGLNAGDLLREDHFFYWDTGTNVIKFLKPLLLKKKPSRQKCPSTLKRNWDNWDSSTTRDYPRADLAQGAALWYLRTENTHLPREDDPPAPPCAGAAIESGTVSKSRPYLGTVTKSDWWEASRRRPCWRGHPFHLLGHRVAWTIRVTRPDGGHRHAKQVNLYQASASAGRNGRAIELACRVTALQGTRRQHDQLVTILATSAVLPAANRPNMALGGITPKQKLALAA